MDHKFIKAHLAIQWNCPHRKKHLHSNTYYVPSGSLGQGEIIACASHGCTPSSSLGSPWNSKQVRTSCALRISVLSIQMWCPRLALAAAVLSIEEIVISQADCADWLAEWRPSTKWHRYDTAYTLWLWNNHHQTKSESTRNIQLSNCAFFAGNGTQLHLHCMQMFNSYIFRMQIMIVVVT